MVRDSPFLSAAGFRYEKMAKRSGDADSAYWSKPSDVKGLASCSQGNSTFTIWMPKKIQTEPNHFWLSHGVSGFASAWRSASGRCSGHRANTGLKKGALPRAFSQSQPRRIRDPPHRKLTTPSNCFFSYTYS